MTRTVPGLKVPRKVMKGGSYLCAPTRMAQEVDTSIRHLGFHCIVRVARGA